MECLREGSVLELGRYGLRGMAAMDTERNAMRERENKISRTL